MAIAKDGTGVWPTTRALASQVHPVFMLPPLAASVFGAVVAGVARPAPLLGHVVALFFAVYTAHLKDGYVDFYRRGEDETHPLTAGGCRLALVGSTLGFACGLGYLWYSVGVGAALITLPTWFLGYFHAPQLDCNPVTATLGYPFGIALAILGGYYLQSGALSAQILAFALVFLLLLSAIKIIDDAQDYEYDRSIDKRTVAVTFGLGRSRSVAYALMGLAAVTLVAFTIEGVFPPSAPAAAVVFGAVAALAYRFPPRTATMLLIRGSYLFLAFLTVSVWFRPLSGVPLPDITVLGPYTYLATEVLWGAVAVALVVRAGVVRAAARTVAVLYPFAYVWDWYTLEVGVFAIPMRTGVELLGIPLEEHLFMIVVPTLVVGVHETLRDLFDE